MAKRFAVKTLTYRLGILLLLLSYNAGTQFFYLFCFTYVSTTLKSDNKHRVFSYQCLCGFICFRDLGDLHNPQFLGCQLNLYFVDRNVRGDAFEDRP
jgi:hypothetical protein